MGHGVSRGRRAGAALGWLVLLLAGCDGEVEPEDGRADLEVGEVLRIPLGVNPGVGDDFEVRGPEDDEVLRSLGSEYVSSDPTGELDGAGGTETFRFEAVAPGTAEVVLFNGYRGCDEDGRLLDPSEREEEVRITVTVAG